MARNFSLTYSNGTPLNVKDLTVGQELVRFIFPHWSVNSTQQVETTTWTITKILKTCVVVVSSEGTEKRIKLERSTYPGSLREGQLTNDVQGEDKYDRRGWNFATTDDPKVAEISETNEYRARKSAALQAAVPAVDAVRGYGVEDPEKIAAAIEALQALLAAINSEDK